MKHLKIFISYISVGLFFIGLFEPAWGKQKLATVPGPYPVRKEISLPFPPTHMVVSDKDSTAYILSPIVMDSTSYLARADTQIRQLIDINNLNAKVTNLLLNPAGDTLYLTALALAPDQVPQVLILNTHQHQITSKIPLPINSFPGSMILSPDQNTLYVSVRGVHDANTNLDYMGVAAINLLTKKIDYFIPLTLTQDPEEGADITVTSDGTQVYINTSGVGGVVGFNTKTHEILFPPEAPHLVYVSPPKLAISSMDSAGDFLYIVGVDASLFRANVTLINLRNTISDQPVKKLTFPNQMGRLLLQLSRDGNTAYLINDKVTAGKGNEINALNIKTGKGSVIPITDSHSAININGIALSEEGSMIYLTGVKQQGDTLNGVIRFVAVPPA